MFGGSFTDRVVHAGEVDRLATRLAAMGLSGRLPALRQGHDSAATGWPTGLDEVDQIILTEFFRSRTQVALEHAHDRGGRGIVIESIIDHGVARMDGLFRCTGIMRPVRHDYAQLVGFVISQPQ
jgi:hypothetical protein